MASTPPVVWAAYLLSAVALGARGPRGQSEDGHFNLVLPVLLTLLIFLVLFIMMIFLCELVLVT